MGLAGLLGGPLAALVPSDRAEAEATVRSVVAKASAQGVRAVYSVPDYVVVSQIFDGGGPVTQAEADSTGRSTSFAALPYPGENAVAAPGTLSAAFGRSVPAAYPLYVRADHPTAPEAKLADPSGSYSLAAKAVDGTATATGALEATDHVSGSRSSSTARLDDGGVVRTVAESVTTGISLGDGALRIASVTTRSETVLRPSDAQPVTTTSLVVEGASVAGHAVTIGADGVHAEGQSLPAPVGRGAGTDNQFLGQLGLSARVVPTGVPGGADALVITSSQTFPAPGNPKGTLVLTFGGAASEITVGSPDASALDSPATDAGGGPAPPDPAAPPERTAAEAGPSAAVPAGEGAAGGLAPEPPAVVALGDSVTLPVAAPPDASGSTSPGGESSELTAFAPAPVPVMGVTRLPVQPDLATTGALYSLLGLGGVCLVAATRLLRWKAGR